MRVPKVGVIGAGQLARMMIGPAADLGVNIEVFAASSDDSAALISAFMVGDFKKIEDLMTFAEGCDVVTFEHELVPQSLIHDMESRGVCVYPSGDSFLYSQDKLAMREKIAQLGLLNPLYEKYEGGSTGLKFPLVAKVPRGGYDGRGVWIISDQAQLSELPTPLLLEEKLNFTREISVMVARSRSGETKTWSPTWTEQCDGICKITVTPVPDFSDDLAEEVSRIAIKIADGVGLVGVMAVELFHIDDRFVVNELALRPHNSGHWTIEGAVTSQFEQHLRAILDLPLGDTKRISDWAVMGNILGGSQPEIFAQYEHMMARSPRLKFHHYRKEIKEGRKIGHVLLLGWDCDFHRLVDEVEFAQNYLSGGPHG
ncbi:MAG: 5-(carboxyamino)imidazole ribonucleotide synthase [Actinobacteria bacterium]|nr:5-(carboxyamino)imidazole ribonucleotide synthase [Actinomycetota bacterium]